MTEPLTMVILGGSGDLAQRLLLPGLAELVALDETIRVTVIGAGLQDPGDYPQVVRQSLHSHGIPEVEAARVASHCRWQTTDATDPADLARLLGHLSGRVLLYFALPPSITKDVVDALAQVDLPNDITFALEKPFGTDADSADQLTAALHRFTDEEHISRIDHFLAMSATVNLRGLLETNRPLSATWNRTAVESITIVYDETLGLEGRATYYDSTGAARDMLQSHLLQVMAHALADPADGPAGAAAVLRATTLVDDVTKAARRARWTAGRVGGVALPGYAAEPGVDPDRQSETLAQVTLAVDTDAWRDVPVVLRSGKAIGNPRQEIAVRYRSTGSARGTELRLHFENDQVGMEMNVADPGHPRALQRVTLQSDLVPSRLSAYGRVLRSLVWGGRPLEVHADAAVQGWRILEPVLAAFDDGSVPLEEYPAGSPGPPGW